MGKISTLYSGDWEIQTGNLLVVSVLPETVITQLYVLLHFLTEGGEEWQAAPLPRILLTDWLFSSVTPHSTHELDTKWI